MLHQFCIMLVSRPSLRCSCRKKIRLMQRSKGFGHGVVVSKNCCNILIAPLWLLQRKLLPLWVGSGAASVSADDVCKMWGTAERRFVRHVCLRNPFPPNSRYSFLQGHLNHEEIKESVSVDYWVGSHNPARTPGSMFESWISDRFEWFFVVNFMYPNLLSSLDPSNSYSCLSQWSFDYIDFLVSGLQGQPVRHLAKVGPMFPCNKGHEAKNNCGDWDFSHSGLEARLPAFQLPMFSKCDALPKGDLWEMLFFSGIYFAIFSSKDIQRQGRCLSCETVMDSNDFSP